MKIFKLERSQTVPYSIKEVFSFFEKPENLASITPSNINFKILTPSPVHMKEGALIDYVLSVRGLPLRWTTLITHYDPPFQFQDVQIKGPYSFWHHTHLFEETSQGTLCKDIVLYSLPFGILGEWLHSLFIRKDLDTIFKFRSEKICSLWASKP